MKKLFTYLVFSVCSLSGISQDNRNLTEYSFTEFFQAIEQEQGLKFSLSDALITIDSNTDGRFIKKESNSFIDSTLAHPDQITIDKIVELTNVHFQYGTSLNNVLFEQELVLTNSSGFHFIHSNFQEAVEVVIDDQFVDRGSIRSYQSFVKSSFLASIRCTLNPSNSDAYFQFDFEQNHVVLDRLIERESNFNLPLSFSTNHHNVTMYLNENMFDYGENPIEIRHYNRGAARETENRNLIVTKNEFIGTGELILSVGDIGYLVIINNQFPRYVTFSGSKLDKSYQIHWPDFASKLIYAESRNALLFGGSLNPDLYFGSESAGFAEKMYKEYRIESEYAYNSEMQLRGMFIDHYREKRNSTWANMAFVEMKDLETARLRFLYHANPTFDTFFTLKINQFLKLFSDYGTRPSKAIVFAVYVIVFFAAIYLFFPNSWDEHGRTRLMNRYRFFLKYLNRPGGASEVYLEEKNKELLPLHEFKQYLEENGKTAPGFFYFTGLPLYKWSVSGSRFSGWILSKLDVLKGTWSELPPSGRWLKSMLVIGTFLIALLYDLFIKVLNAVMLSINTFTTLGFGEIPIKGLPRYLAIIQGFIGWFMLTIFSVSLISQLLN